MSGDVERSTLLVGDSWVVSTSILKIEDLTSDQFNKIYDCLFKLKPKEKGKKKLFLEQIHEVGFLTILT